MYEAGTEFQRGQIAGLNQALSLVEELIIGNSDSWDEALNTARHALVNAIELEKDNLEPELNAPISGLYKSRC